MQNRGYSGLNGAEQPAQASKGNQRERLVLAQLLAGNAAHSFAQGDAKSAEAFLQCANGLADNRGLDELLEVLKGAQMPSPLKAPQPARAAAQPSQHAGISIGHVGSVGTMVKGDNNVVSVGGGKIGNINPALQVDYAFLESAEGRASMRAGTVAMYYGQAVRAMDAGDEKALATAQQELAEFLARDAGPQK